MELVELQEILRAKYPELNAIPIKWSDIVFEERVKQKCFHCANYHTKWTCPGHLPVIDYKELVREYEHAAVINDPQVEIMEVEGEYNVKEILFPQDTYELIK